MGARTTQRALALRLLLLCLPAFLSGCAGSKPKGLLSTLPGAKVTELELKAQLRDAAYRFILETEDLGYDLYIDTTDPSVRRAALMMVIRVGEEASFATFLGDPLAGLVDLWGLTAQVRQYYEEGDGRDVFGAQQPVVVDFYRRMQDRFAALAASLVEVPTGEGRAVVEQWALENPVTGRSLSRSSTATLLARLLPKRDGGLLAMTETMEEGMADISNRIEAMQMQLPGQLVMRSLMVVDQKLGELDGGALLARIDRLQALLDQIPGLVDEQRRAIMQSVREERIAIVNALRQEREAILRDIDTQRVETLEQIDAMRVAMFQDIDRQRVESFESLQELTKYGFEQVGGERVAIFEETNRLLGKMLDSIDKQRKETLVDLEVIIESRVDQSANRIFWMMVKLGVGFFVGILLMIIAVRVLWRGSR